MSKFTDFSSCMFAKTASGLTTIPMELVADSRESSTRRDIFNNLFWNLIDAF